MAVLLATSCAIPGKFRLRFEFQFSQNSVITKKLKRGILFTWNFISTTYHDIILFETFKEEKILKGSLDSIPSPPPSVKIQIMGSKVFLRCKG